MSKIVKGVGKAVGGVVRGIGKAVKGIVKGVGKVFKKVWKSTVGKIVLTAVAIWLGGWALGAWAGPGGAAAGSAAGTTAGTTAGTGLGAGAGVTASGVSAVGPTAGAYTFGGTQGIVGNALSTSLTSAGAGAGGAAGAAGAAAANAGGWQGVPSTAPSSLPPGVGGENTTYGTGGAEPGYTTAADVPAAAEASAQGFKGYNVGEGIRSSSSIVSTIRGLGGGIADWTKNNQLLAAMGVSGLAGAFGAAAERDYNDEERRRREKNLEAAGSVDLGFRPSGRPLTRISTGEPVYGPTGIINSSRIG
jgi:hypothetical protein